MNQELVGAIFTVLSDESKDRIQLDERLQEIHQEIYIMNLLEFNNKNQLDERLDEINMLKKKLNDVTELKILLEDKLNKIVNPVIENYLNALKQIN